MVKIVMILLGHLVSLITVVFYYCKLDTVFGFSSAAVM